MNRFTNMIKSIASEDGAVAIIVAVLTAAVFFGLAALAIDIGHLAVVKNELQNAADAGALAGARVLYTTNGKNFDPTAGQTAEDAAEANNSDKDAVVANWNNNVSDNDDVQIGHWSFSYANDNDPSTKAFTRYTGDLTTYEPYELVDYIGKDLQLDTDTNFINAVKVRARNPDAQSFFARILGHESFNYQADAVGYIGFAGKLEPAYVDEPIVLCSDYIFNEEGNLQCNVGRMINSGKDETEGKIFDFNTGAWTDFSQPEPCTGGANTARIKPLVCTGNTQNIDLRKDVRVLGGEAEAAFHNLVSCWKANADSDDADKIPDRTWPINVLVVICDKNNPSGCVEPFTAVTVEVVWITETFPASEKNKYQDVPRKMETDSGTWTCDSDVSGEQCWTNFVSTFGLVDPTGEDVPAPYEQKAIYFKPVCAVGEWTGGSEGENHGVLARVPKLVE